LISYFYWKFSPSSMYIKKQQQSFKRYQIRPWRCCLINFFFIFPYFSRFYVIFIFLAFFFWVLGFWIFLPCLRSVSGLFQSIIYLFMSTLSLLYFLLHQYEMNLKIKNHWIYNSKFIFLDSSKLHPLESALCGPRWASKTSAIPGSYKRCTSWLELETCCVDLKPFAIMRRLLEEPETCHACLYSISILKFDYSYIPIKTSFHVLDGGSLVNNIRKSTFIL
jgi:hypothetical protein